MRLIVLIVLAGFLALAVLPQTGMAGDTPGAHDCTACPAEMPGHDPADGAMSPDCANAGLCAIAMIPGPSGTPGAVAPRRARHARPVPVPGRTLTVPFDLPPPRL